MEKEKKIFEEVEKTISVLERMKKLEPNPFLYTRIKAEMGKRTLKNTKKTQLPFAIKPTIIFVILLLNLFTAIYFFKTNPKQDTSELLINELKADYQISQTQNDLLIGN